MPKILRANLEIYNLIRERQYMPLPAAAGFVGTETFTVQVSDGVESALRAVPLGKGLAAGIGRAALRRIVKEPRVAEGIPADKAPEAVLSQ